MLSYIRNAHSTAHTHILHARLLQIILYQGNYEGNKVLKTFLSHSISHIHAVIFSIVEIDPLIFFFLLFLCTSQRIFLMSFTANPSWYRHFYGVLLLVNETLFHMLIECVCVRARFIFCLQAVHCNRTASFYRLLN